MKGPRCTGRSRLFCRRGQRWPAAHRHRSSRPAPAGAAARARSSRLAWSRTILWFGCSCAAPALVDWFGRRVLTTYWLGTPLRTPVRCLPPGCDAACEVIRAPSALACLLVLLAAHAPAGGAAATGSARSALWLVGGGARHRACGPRPSGEQQRVPMRAAVDAGRTVISAAGDRTSAPACASMIISRDWHEAVAVKAFTAPRWCLGHRLRRCPTVVVLMRRQVSSFVEVASMPALNERARAPEGHFHQ